MYGGRWLGKSTCQPWPTALREIAKREKIDNSYVSRMANLTTLAPDIVAAILDDSLPNAITLFNLAVDPPGLWKEQRMRIEEVAHEIPSAGNARCGSLTSSMDWRQRKVIHTRGRSIVNSSPLSRS